MCGETRLRPCQLSPVIVQLNCGVIGVSEYKRMTRTTWQRPQVADAEANALSEAFESNLAPLLLSNVAMLCIITVSVSLTIAA